MSSRALGDYFTLQRGTTYKSALLDRPGPALLGLASIARNGGFRTDNLRTYGGDSPDKLLLRPDDLYVALKDVTQSADLLGAVSRVPKHIHLGRLTQDTVKLVFKSGKDNTRHFIYWLLRTPQYREYCRARAIGTTNLSLTREDFLSFPVPELTDERAAAVQVLEALEQKEELNRCKNQTLEDIAGVIFKSWFVDNVSFHHPSTVGIEFSLTMGQSPPGDTYNEVGDGLPFFQGTTDFGFRFPATRVYCAAPARIAEAGDTLVSVRAPVGEINMANQRCCIGRGVAALRHKSGSRSYTYYCVQGLKAQLEAFEAEGTVFGSIGKDQFKSLKVSAPPDHAVERFEQKISPFDELIEKNEVESKTLVALRDFLLPRLISGGVRVPNQRSLEAST